MPEPGALPSVPNDPTGVFTVDESRPRLRSRRDGRMSAAGRLVERAAEAAAAAGVAMDGIPLVVCPMPTTVALDRYWSTCRYCCNAM